ncbi:MAG: PHP domain-containing protein [Defluviitaleaceae bacterium]|nr:PHP domain-containing protein [Defluviitaleaceae bacterium]
MYADLHLHTTHSDGTDTPHELITLAKTHGIQVISITDHDSVAAHLALANTPIDGIRIIPGIELSTETDHKMIHILGYYIDPTDAKFQRTLQDLCADKTKTTRINFENARANKVFDFEWARVLELNEGQSRISGVHVLKAMQADGYEMPGMGLWDMFSAYFWPGNDNYVSGSTFTGYDAIDIIKANGGIPVIAHPKTIYDDDTVRDLIRHGAQGIEVFHPKHSTAEVAKYRQIAEDTKIYISGGTDWHGKNNNPEVTHFGQCGLDSAAYLLLGFMEYKE